MQHDVTFVSLCTTVKEGERVRVVGARYFQQQGQVCDCTVAQVAEWSSSDWEVGASIPTPEVSLLRCP